MARTGSSSPPSTTPVSSTDKLVKSSSDNLARQKAAAAAAAAAAKRPQRPILDTLKKEELKSKAIKAHQKAQGMSQTMVVSLVMGAAAVLFALLLLLKSPAQTTSVDSRATLMKAVELLHGDGVRNEEKGMELLRKAADLGNAEAQHRMGYFYTVGNTVVEPDYTEAFKWFSLAANQGSSDSMVNLGLAYAQGNGVERSYENALSWWKKAAKRRNAMAMGHLGRCHEYGLGTEVDLQKAMAQYQQGAAMGDALSTYHLGNFYLKGMNTVKDPKKALEFFKQAYSKGYLLAATALGELHLRGEGVEKNLRTALGYFQQAAEKGEPTALYHVALAHDTNVDEKGDTITAGKENQFGIMYNPTMAFEAFERAANAGSSDAMFQMALNLESGAAGKIDSKEAYKWLVAAAQSGNPRAAYEMVNKNGSSEYGGLIELSDDQVDQMLRLALRSPDKNIKNEVIKLLDERSKGEEEEEDVEIVEEEVEA